MAEDQETPDDEFTLSTEDGYTITYDSTVREFLDAFGLGPEFLIAAVQSAEEDDGPTGLDLDNDTLW